MSKNYDLIATVDIDITSPIVDNTSFDKLLIMGPAPKGEHSSPSIGVYSSLEEVQEAGFVVSGENPDPVGAAALVAFSQSPTPAAIYIAIQKPSKAAIAAAKTISDANKAITELVGTNPEINGCSATYDLKARTIDVTLTTSFATASGHGLFDALAVLVEQGYTATVDGITVHDYAQFTQTVYNEQLIAMTKGSDPIRFEMKVFKEGTPEVTYVITVAYPNTKTKAGEVTDVITEPVDSPEKEIEPIADTVSRALGKTGWYVLCTAGVPEENYEEIAQLIEAQEKMFVYTETNYFNVETDEDGESVNIPAVGDVYFRSCGVYGAETSTQTFEEMPEANKYLNVAWVTEWLRYDTGSETPAFKELAAVYPSELTTTEMKELEESCISFFVTVGNKNLILGGKTRAGEWADIIRFRDWLKNDMQVRVVNLFATTPKIPYTDRGIALIQNQMLASLKAGQDKGGIAEEEFDENGNSIPGYSTSVPLAASIPASVKASRKLFDCKFKARIAGAVHFAELKGSLTYAL